MTQIAQCRAALAGANANRAKAARWRADLASGKATMEDVLAERPACLRIQPVLRLLTWCHRWGTVRAAVLNERAVAARINLALPLAAVDERTAEWLRAALRAGVPQRLSRAPKRPRSKRKPNAKPAAALTYLPSQPFVEWLERNMPRPEDGRADWVKAHGMSIDQIRKLRSGETRRARVVVVDRALLYEDVNLGDLYPEHFGVEAA